MIRFNVLTNHDDKSLRLMIADLTNNRGFSLVGIRESDILDENDAKVGEVYIICLKGSAWDYMQFRKECINKHKMREINYEGVRTLC